MSAEFVAFTIAARNFIPYAKVLHASLVSHHSDIRFFLALSDTSEGLDLELLPFPIIELQDLEDSRIWGMAERFNITEFSTSIKPFVFRTLMDRHPGGHILYFDPDIFVTSPLEEIQRAFAAGASITLTPHITRPIARPEFDDSAPLKFGIYNLGFLGVRDDVETRALMQWWSDRLEKHCVVDLPNGFFVDQKWCDLMPAMVERSAIIRHPGYNVAYWNLLQRTVAFSDGTWTVNGEPLRFVHFSGNELAKPGIFSRHAPYLDAAAVGDLRFLLEYYRSLVIKAGYLSYGRFPYAFRWAGTSGVNLHTIKSIKEVLQASASDIDVHIVPFANTDALQTQGTGASEGSVSLTAPGDLFVAEINSWADFTRLRSANEVTFAKHRAIELEHLAGGQVSFTVPGICSMCRTSTALRVSYMYAYAHTADGRLIPNWREHLDCRYGFTNRIHAAMLMMTTTIQLPPDARIYLTEQVTPLFKWLKLRWAGTTGSEFLGPDRAPGEIHNGIRHEDMGRLSFDDGSFDLVLSFDVLEHVEDLHAALTEAFRELRPGGSMLFSAPTQFDRTEIVDRVLVRPDGTYEYLCEPEYHGNPVGPEKGALCFRYLGLAVLDLMRRIGFRETRALMYWSRSYGYFGENQIIFLCRK